MRRDNRAVHCCTFKAPKSGADISAAPMGSPSGSTWSMFSPLWNSVSTANGVFVGASISSSSAWSLEPVVSLVVRAMVSPSRCVMTLRK